MSDMKDSVGQYLDEIGSVPLLDAAQERELAQTIEAGRAAQARLDTGEQDLELERAVQKGARAKDHFIRANLRLVVSAARRYPVPPGMDLLDVIQEGNLGLEHAVDKFDWRRGFKFSTYAMFWIRQAIGRALDQKGNLIRLPGERSAELRAALRSSGGAREELPDHLAELDRLSTVTSLDRPVNDDGSTDLGDLVAADDVSPEMMVVDQVHREQVVGLLDSLEPRPRQVVALRMGLVDGRPRSFREVGDDIDVTSEAARRMFNRALKQLRGEAEGMGLAA